LSGFIENASHGIMEPTLHLGPIKQSLNAKYETPALIVAAHLAAGHDVTCQYIAALTGHRRIVTGV
jgi:hypothetical protein